MEKYGSCCRHSVAPEVVTDRLPASAPSLHTSFVDVDEPTGSRDACMATIRAGLAVTLQLVSNRPAAAVAVLENEDDGKRLAISEGEGAPSLAR